MDNKRCTTWRTWTWAEVGKGVATYDHVANCFRIDRVLATLQNGVAADVDVMVLFGRFVCIASLDAIATTARYRGVEHPNV